MFRCATNGMATTSAARIRSLAIITRFWSQRSTKVPANGPEHQVRKRRREEDEGRVLVRLGDRQTRAADGDLVEAVAEQADGLGDPEGAETGIADEAGIGMAAGALLAAAALVRPRSPGSAPASGAASPGPMPPPSITGRPSVVGSMSAAGSWPGVEPRHRATPTGCGSGSPRSRVASTNQPRPTEMSTSPRLTTFGSRGIGNGMMSARGPAWSRKSRLQLGRQDDVEGRREVARAQAGRCEGRHVDRHPAAVESHRQTVRGHAGHDDQQARLGAVQPEHAARSRNDVAYRGRRRSSAIVTSRSISSCVPKRSRTAARSRPAYRKRTFRSAPSRRRRGARAPARPGCPESSIGQVPPRMRQP